MKFISQGRTRLGLMCLLTMDHRNRSGAAGTRGRRGERDSGNEFPPDYDLAEEQQRQGRAWRHQIELELEQDLSDLDDEAAYRNVSHISRGTLLQSGGTIRDVKRVLNRADVAAIPYDMLWHFLNESGNAAHFLPASEVARFLQVRSLPEVLSDRAIAEEPGAIAATARSPSPPVPPPAPVAERALKKWWETWKGKNPGHSEDAAWAAAKSEFPQNDVSRRRIRDLRGRQKAGRKPKSAGK